MISCGEHYRQVSHTFLVIFMCEALPPTLLNNYVLLMFDFESGCHTVNTMVLGCQERDSGGSLQGGGNQDCALGALWLEGNYLLGCLAGLLGALLGCLEASNVANRGILGGPWKEGETRTVHLGLSG